MGRSRLSWLLLGGMGLALWACGDSGSPTGIPPAGFSYDANEDPYGSFNEPPTSDNEAPTSFNETMGCGSEQRLALSDILLDISVPYCEFQASCYETDAPPQPMPGQGVTPNDGTVQIRDLSLGLEDIPPFCLELAMSRSGDGQDSSDCALTEALAHVAKEFPACDQDITLPAGYCFARIESCVHDLIKGGCASYLSGDYPLYCAEIVDDSSDETPPVPSTPN